MEVPVYLFTGFLESGKTSFLKDNLKDESFTEGKRTLVLLCEEGEVEIEEALRRTSGATVVTVTEQQSLTRAFLEDCAKKYRPDRVMLEWNGMWPLTVLTAALLPKNWIIFQVVATVCGGTFELYAANMGAHMLEHIAGADLVIFNRCTQENKETLRARNLRAMNPRAAMFIENMDGTPEEYAEGMAVPFDLDADVIEVADADYGLWYVDAMNDPEKYEGKTVKITGIVHKEPDLAEDVFIPGRFGMVCCADDIAFIGFLCHSPQAAALQTGSFVTVTARVAVEYYPQYRGDGPVLYAEEIQPAQKPDPELVYFN